MKVLVSFMRAGFSFGETIYGHTELELDSWDTSRVEIMLGRALNIPSNEVIITNVFEIPTSRFTKQEKDNLKHWIQLASEFIESDDDVQYDIIQNLIKELNE